MNRPRITDVARLAGVSTATVSRALSRPERVSAETRATIERAIAETGYRLNLAARNLRHQRTGSIVALVPNLANPYFSQILSGIATVLSPAGYNLLVADTRTTNPLRYADPSHADGLIVLDGSVPPSVLAERPAVIVSESIPGLSAPCVLIDNEAAAEMAVTHLADLGHRSIGHVTGPRSNVLTEQRLSGTMRAAAARGLPKPAVIEGDFSLASGRRAAQAWLDMADRPTGMFLASDEMACGFIGELQRHGISVPRDVSVIGFDDIEMVEHLTPGLTTIRQPRGAMGRGSAERLLGILNGDGEEGDTILPVELILRASTAIPR